MSAGGDLPPGEFHISGEQHFLPPSQLVFGFGIVFRLADDSLARHAGDRALVATDESAASKLGVDVGAVGASAPAAHAAAAESAGRRRNLDAPADTRDSASDQVSSDAPAASSGASDEGGVGQAQERNEAGAPDDDSSGSEQETQVATGDAQPPDGGSAAAAASTAQGVQEEQSEDTNSDQQLQGHVTCTEKRPGSGLLSQLERDSAKQATPSAAPRAQFASSTATSGHDTTEGTAAHSGEAAVPEQASSKPASASAQAYAQPARAKTPSAPPPPPPRKRGKAAKARRAKEKYKNQDDEDAALLAEANAATGPAKSRATRRAERKAKNAAKKAAVLEVWLSSTVLNACGVECYHACSLWCNLFCCCLSTGIQRCTGAGAIVCEMQQAMIHHKQQHSCNDIS